MYNPGRPDHPIQSAIHVSVNNLRVNSPGTKKTAVSGAPSKKRFSPLVNKFMDYAPYPVLLVDKSGHIIQCNPAFQTLVQSSAEEIFGTFFLQWVREEDREKTEKALFESRTARETRVFENGCCAAGQPSILLKWSVHWDHTEKRLYCFGEIKMEESDGKIPDDLKLSNERYHLVAKATHDMIWDWDLQKNEIFRNEEGLSSIYGFSNNDPIRRIDDWVERIHPGDRNRVKKAIAAIHDAGPGVLFQVEYRFLKGDNNYVFIYDRGYILRDPSGKPIRLIGAAQDITERVRLQHQLSEEKNARQKEIMKATIGVQEKERDQIAYELHDNVNQILTSAKLYIECVGLYDEQKEQYRLMSEKLINAGIEEIRRLSKSLVRPSLDEVGLIRSIEEVLENIRITRQLSVTFEHSSFDEKKCEHGLQIAIYRIVQEQSINILKHSQATAFGVELTTGGDQLVLKITDNGKGFDASLLRKGIGFTNIANRSAVYRGKVDIITSPGNGCVLSIVFKHPYTHKQTAL